MMNEGQNPENSVIRFRSENSLRTDRGGTLNRTSGRVRTDPDTASRIFPDFGKELKNYVYR